MEKRFSVILMGVLLAGPAAAQTELNLQASGIHSVPPDEITANLSVQSSAADAASAQAKVNGAMRTALGLAKHTAGVTATTDGYSVLASTPDGSTQAVYQASQELDLVMPAPGGVPPAAFTALVGNLQQSGLLLNSLAGDLSAKGQALARQAAIDDAISQILAQEDAIATRLHEAPGVIKTLTVNINTPGPFRPGPMMMMAAKAAAPPPQAAPANVPVEADVSAVIDLRPGD
jgi:uncharacterized protein YggE